MAPYDFYSFPLNFPISRENRNLEPITIRDDVGHPVYKIQVVVVVVVYCIV